MRELPRFPNVVPRKHPRTGDINTAAHKWVVDSQLVPVDRADPDRLKNYHYGALIGHLYPDATYEDALLWAEWYSWWFVVDDQVLTWDLDEFAMFATRAEVAIRRGGSVEEQSSNLVKALTELCRRTVASVPAVLYPVIAASLIDALSAMHKEVAHRTTGRTPRTERLAPNGEYLVGRIAVFGGVFDFAVYETCRGFVVPPELRITPEWQDIIDLGMTVAILQNDIVGVRQDEADGEIHNAVRLLELQQGLSRAEAIGVTNAAIADAIDRFRRTKRGLGRAVTRLGLPPEHTAKVTQLADDIEWYSEGAQAWYLETSRYAGEQHLTRRPPHGPPRRGSRGQ